MWNISELGTKILICKTYKVKFQTYVSNKYMLTFFAFKTSQHKYFWKGRIEKKLILDIVLFVRFFFFPWWFIFFSFPYINIKRKTLLQYKKDLQSNCVPAQGLDPQKNVGCKKDPIRFLLNTFHLFSIEYLHSCDFCDRTCFV